MNTPSFELSAAHHDAARAYRAAVAELERRTGREFWPCSGALPERHVGEDEVLRDHPDLRDALGVRPCADGCGRAAVRYWEHRHLCAEHVRASSIR